jgi:hypothetical protein
LQKLDVFKKVFGLWLDFGGGYPLANQLRFDGFLADSFQFAFLDLVFFVFAHPLINWHDQSSLKILGTSRWPAHCCGFWILGDGDIILEKHDFLGPACVLADISLFRFFIGWRAKKLKLYFESDKQNAFGSTVKGVGENDLQSGRSYPFSLECGP